MQLIWGTDDTILEPRQDAELLGGWAGHVEGWWVVGGSHAIIADSTLPVCEKVQASYASLAAWTESSTIQISRAASLLRASLISAY